ncbi:ATP-binding cassette domain-containing protein [Micromonospora sp. URMC 103]|uniref:ATP-binding cassette domain-containing protein n=1 Tax=Micromonospora sp. URMC 103 TaxID=3423406 RepID=UPI003F199EC5
MNSSHLAVEATGLVKTFGTTRAVDGIDLSIPVGSVYGFLGPNGAGKTTTIRMLATLLRPDAGSARVFGHDVVRHAAAVRDRIGLTGQYASLDDGLTARENLVLLGRLHGHSRAGTAARAEELLNAFSLTEAADRLVKTYSGGMRRRLDIAAGLIVTPDLLFLDEPTTGLDPRSRNDVWNLVGDLVAEGGTVLLTTQYLDEADQLADRIAVIDHGTVIAQGTSGQLKALVGGGSLHVRLAEPDDRAAAEELLTQALHGPVARVPDPAALTAQVPDSGPAAAEAAAHALAELSRAQIEVTEFTLGQPSLDEVFLALTSRPAAADATRREKTK